MTAAARATLHTQLRGSYGASAAGITVDYDSRRRAPSEKVRPDIAVYVKKRINGYVELKQPGLGADAPRLAVQFVFDALEFSPWAKAALAPGVRGDGQSI